MLLNLYILSIGSIRGRMYAEADLMRDSLQEKFDKFDKRGNIQCPPLKLSW